MANAASLQNEEQLRAVEQHMEELWHYQDVPRIAAACSSDPCRASSDEQQSCERGAETGHVSRFVSLANFDCGGRRGEIHASSCSPVERTDMFVLRRGGVPDVSKVREVFELIDADGDKRISTTELVAFLEKFNLSLALERAHAVLNSADENGDGVLEYAEFVKLYASLCLSKEEIDEAEREQCLRDAFTVFDSNNDGFISPSELKGVVQSLNLRKGRPARDFLAMIRAVDRDGDGLVNFEDFKAMMLDVSRSPSAWSFAEFLRAATCWKF